MPSRMQGKKDGAAGRGSGGAAGDSSGQSDGEGHQPTDREDETGFPVDPGPGWGTADGAALSAHRGNSLS